MEKIMTFETIEQFAYVNFRYVKQPIRGIVLQFFGLGHNKMCKEDLEEGKIDKYVEYGKRYGEKGLLYVFPYNNPWNWMNPQAVAYTDEVIDVLLHGLGLSENTPIVSTGGSMGGQSALVYTCYAKRTPVACVTNCPVCDMPYHFTERKDLPRTLYSALGTMPYDTMEEALRTVSPLDLVDSMPDVPYYIFHCEEDRAVNLAKHSLRFVERMEKAHRITLHRVPERGHCDLTPEMAELFEVYVAGAILGE